MINGTARHETPGVSWSGVLLLVEWGPGRGVRRVR